ncbi:MAG: lysylphosphatidylglycerol synthase transmembrane domain-containing protein [Gemmatimonadota bacterium]
MRLKRWQSWTLRLIGTAALIVGVFWFIPLSEVINVLEGVKPGYLAGGFAVFLLGSYLQAFQLWLLLKRQGMPQGPWEIFEVNMITRFYGQFLPSELMAGAVKLYRLAGPKKQWGEVVAALAFFRLVNLLALVLLGIVFWAIDMPSGPGRWVGLLMIGMAAALVAMHLVLASPGAGGMVKRLLPARGLSWLQGKLLEKGRTLMRATVQSYQLFGDLVMTISALAVLRHALGILSFSLFALSLDVHLSLLTIGWIRVVLQVLLMLPISLSGIGVREGSLVILLQEYGVTSSQAVALAFLLFASVLVGNSLGGLFELKNVLRSDRRGLTVRSGVE